MAKKSDTKTRTNTVDSNGKSELAKFHLSFEYNHTWTEAKRNGQGKPTKSR